MEKTSNKADRKGNWANRAWAFVRNAVLIHFGTGLFVALDSTTKVRDAFPSVFKNPRLMAVSGTLSALVTFVPEVLLERKDRVHDNQPERGTEAEKLPLTTLSAARLLEGNAISPVTTLERR